MELIENTEKSKSERTLCAAYAKKVPALAADMNALLAKHGIKNMKIQSFSFGKGPGLVSSKDPTMVAGVGATEDGVVVAAMYEK